MIVPVEFRSPIQILISKHIYRNTPRGQIVKSFVLKGWSLESAEIIADGLEKLRDL